MRNLPVQVLWSRRFARKNRIPVGRQRTDGCISPSSSRLSNPTVEKEWELRLACVTAIWILVASGSLWLTASSHAGIPANVTLLNGSPRSGELKSLTMDSVVLTTDIGEEQIAGESIMVVELNSPARPGSGGQMEIRLADQSSIRVSTFESDGTTVSVSGGDLAEIRIPVRQVSDVRFEALDDKIQTRWDDLRSRNARDDLIVIRKGDVLDYVAGSISTVTPTAVTILVRDRELSAPREKIFGLVFASRSSPASIRRIAVRTIHDDVIQAESVQLSGQQWRLTSSSLGEVTLPQESVQSLDFGGGRIRYLADIPFDQSESKSPQENAPVVWFVSRNSPSGTGGRAPLLIGQQEYRKGLWMHSGASLRFRLNREYTQLRAMAGFDLTHVTRMPRFEPKVRLVILGDGKELYSREFLWSDNPVPLEINLTDVRELTIRVDSAGKGHGILEHFALGDAQVIQ